MRCSTMMQVLLAGTLGGCGSEAAGVSEGESSDAADAGGATGGTTGETMVSTSGDAQGTGPETSGIGSSSGTSVGDDGSSSDGTGEVDACATDVERSDTVVLSSGGPLQGRVTEVGPIAFLGIPYAAPPVGPLRWAPPEPPACWTETFDARALGPRCTQLDSEDGPVIGEEDCLQLNVWTPAADAGDRPVMVFIHGGGNAVGSAVDPLYDGASLANAGDQVVITINYRLGVLGWLTHPDLGAINFGLRDQIAALRWVQDNAAAFGGDPARVTVFGESAGAVNTCTLLGAPDAAGLFRAAIVQSGTCSHRDPQTYAEQTSTPFLEASGCADAPDALACLAELDAATLVATEPTGFPASGGLGGQGWGPSIDPDTLPMQSLDAMEAGVHNDVPVIIGANAEENFNNVPEIPDAQTYEALVAASFGPLANAVLAQYPLVDYDSPRDAYVALTSDVRFVCNARRALRAASNGRSPAYRYHFAHDDYFAPGGGDTGAFHGLELVYVFGNFDAIIEGIEYPTTAADEEVRDTMQALWSSFAANAVPSFDPAWPAYDVDGDPYLRIASPVTADAGVRTQQCDFWDQFTGG